MLNENDLQKIIDTVTERLKADFDMVPRSKPVKPEPERLPFFCDRCHHSSLMTMKEIEEHQRSHDKPTTMEATIDRLAAEHEAAFQSSPNDRAHYRLCSFCRGEFLTVESFNGHACAVAGRVLPIVLADHSRPGQSERTAAAMQAERRQAILAKANEYLNAKSNLEVKP